MKIKKITSTPIFILTALFLLWCGIMVSAIVKDISYKYRIGSDASNFCFEKNGYVIGVSHWGQPKVVCQIYGSLNPLTIPRTEVFLINKSIVIGCQNLNTS